MSTFVHLKPPVYSFRGLYLLIPLVYPLIGLLRGYPNLYVSGEEVFKVRSENTLEPYLNVPIPMLVPPKWDLWVSRIRRTGTLTKKRKTEVHRLHGRDRVHVSQQVLTDSMEEIRCICPKRCSSFSDTAFINGPTRCHEWRALYDLKRIHSNDFKFYWWQLCKPCSLGMPVQCHLAGATSVRRQAHLPTTSTLYFFLWWLPFAGSRPDLAALPRGEQRGQFLLLPARVHRTCLGGTYFSPCCSASLIS